jgi:hypothetical protein
MIHVSLKGWVGEIDLDPEDIARQSDLGFMPDHHVVESTALEESANRLGRL